MLGVLSICSSVLLGRKWGLIFTFLAVLIGANEIYFFSESTLRNTYSNLIMYSDVYNFFSILQPGIIVNILSFYFYHVLTTEEQNKKELKFRLEKIIDNSIQSVVLVDSQKRILYADTKTKKMVMENLGFEMNEGDLAEKFVIQSDIHSFNQYIDRAFAGEKAILERRLILPKNVIKWYMVMYAPISDSIGKIDTVQFSLIDITEQKNTQEELEKAEQRWKYALNSSQDGVWDWSVKDGKAYFSKMWKGMLGYEEYDITDSFSEWEKLVHPDDKQRSFEEILKHVKNQTENYVLEHRLMHKNGNYKWILARGKIIERDGFGNPVRFIGTHTDIDPIKRTEEDLKAAQAKSEQAAEAKSQFLSTISHEIRTPLNAVIGFSNLLQREGNIAQDSEYLQNIQTSAGHLLSLVNNVLDISKIESGKVEFEKREFDLEKLIDENMAMLSLRAKEKAIELKRGYIPSLQYSIIGDPLRLTQVLNNLIGNAVKFTDKGHVSVDVIILSDTEKSVELKFSIKDTGTGIAKSKLDSVFESFAQANTDIARRYGGTGLGLTISKLLVNLQGGQIGVDSKIHEGSTFYFNLIFQKGKLLRKADFNKVEEKEVPLTGLRVLVAEDNLFNTKVLTRFLEIWDISYQVAENGSIALELLAESQFDLVLMDLHMPVMDGYETTAKIRESGNLIYIIALTASGNFNSKNEMKDKGFDDYSIKPINTKELYKKLKEVRLKVLPIA
jgi:PAS domain S-box-containing protein